MKKVGIICEYNPFHNGHIYHIKKIKELYPDSLIILVMSSSFTMRGELSFLNKWDKTSIALNYGIDLVIELPTFYATNSADTFSEGAIKILTIMKCDYLVFGSECNNIRLLTKYAQTQLSNPEYDPLVKKYMDEGNNYPTSMSKALKDICNENVYLPNDLLGLSYIKEIIRQKSNIIPISILRTTEYHSTNLTSIITSATSIRNAILNNRDVSSTVPKETNERIIRLNYEDNLFKLLKYKILNNMNDLDKYQDVDEGLDNLIRKNIIKVNNYKELIEVVKNKRYTYKKLNRMFIHILLDIKKDNISKLKKINYIRILGFNNNGKKYIKELRKQINIPIITNYSDIEDSNLDFELYTTCIYNQIINNENLNIKELKSVPIEK